MLTEEQCNDVHYVCALIEYTARETGNFPVTVAKALGEDGCERQLFLAPVNHCLSFAQVADELVTTYHIPKGERDMHAYRYALPYFLDIGYLYAALVEDVCPPDASNLAKTIYNVFTSFLSTEISNFDSALYYSGRGYLHCCYEAGKIIPW